MTIEKKLLEVRNLKRYFKFSTAMGKEFNLKAVDDVSFDIGYNKTLGLVGESGCGKTTAGKTILRLLDNDQGEQDGEVLFEGVNLFELNGKELRKQRRDMQIIFQDPYGSLNPRMSVYQNLSEPYVAYKMGNRKWKREKVVGLLEAVGLSADDCVKFPHEFSGGQRQRICIARAMTLDPKLIIADEPVSALDVSIQADLINLMNELQEKHNMGYLFISHDLHVIENFCDDIAVMYLGKIVEIGTGKDIFHRTRHHYTDALLAATPVIDARKQPDYSKMLTGDVPSPINPPSGCTFHPRCKNCQEICKKEYPELKGRGKHKTACHYPVGS